MVKPNDVIAIIVIMLFFVLTLIAFGIYRLVALARRGQSSSSSGSGSRSGSGSGSGSSRSLADD